jgi:signal transduction histidine kinase
VNDTDLIERLAQHRTLGSAPREELAWLVAHGTLRRLETGQLLAHKGQVVEGMHVILSGRVALFVDRGAGPHKMIEWREGDVTGMLPYSRLQKPPGNAISQEPLEILSVHRDQFREMVRECFEVTTIVVHTMLDRARLFNASELQDEKMISLGKLSAGLAHELNNPASAIERCVSQLLDSLDESEAAKRALEAAKLSDEQLAAVDAIRESCHRKASVARSSMEQVDREDAIYGWLAKHGLDGSNAPMLADSEVTFEALNSLAGVVSGPSLNDVIRWAAADCALRKSSSEIQGSSARISCLVTAVKGFTCMDKAMVAQRVNPGSGLSDSVAVLNSKATEKSVTVALDLNDGLPEISSFAAELNQIWGILIDNALDAVPRGGRVDVSARQEGEHVVVRVIDNGPGIPAENCSRIFDPFFTTKQLGHGTGLGLDIARRLVRHNDGAIDFESEPGRTEFRVTFPVAKSVEADH